MYTVLKCERLYTHLSLHIKEYYVAIRSTAELVKELEKEHCKCWSW